MDGGESPRVCVSFFPVPLRFLFPSPTPCASASPFVAFVPVCGFVISGLSGLGLRRVRGYPARRVAALFVPPPYTVLAAPVFVHSIVSLSFTSLPLVSFHRWLR